MEMVIFFMSEHIWIHNSTYSYLFLRINIYKPSPLLSQSITFALPFVFVLEGDPKKDYIFIRVMFSQVLYWPGLAFFIEYLHSIFRSAILVTLS